jgi:hypothetical protein
VDEQAALVVVHRLDVVAQADRREVRLEVGGIEIRGLVVEPHLDIGEPSPLQPSSGLGRCGEVLAPHGILSQLMQGGLDGRDVPRSSALHRELAARPQDRREIPEESVVIQDPMERGRGQDRVHRLAQGEWLPQIGHHVRHPVAERCEQDPRTLDHGGGAVEGDHASPREALEQAFRDPTGAASSVEHLLVADEIEPSDDGCSPTGHGRAEPIVGVGVPIAGHGGEASGRVPEMVRDTS